MWHRVNRGIQAHLFIPVLAYLVVQTLRLQFKEQGIHWGWQSIRWRLRKWVQVTTTMKTKEYRTITNRQVVRPLAEQAQLAGTCGEPENPAASKTLVSQRE